MYAYIKGIVDETSADRAIVEAGGVGYELFCSTITLKTLILGEGAKLYTHLHLAEGVQALHLPSLLRCYGPYLGPTRTQAWGFGPCSPLRPWGPSQKALPIPWHIPASGDLREQPEACLPTFKGGEEKQHPAGSWTALSFEVLCKGGTVGFSLM